MKRTLTQRIRELIWLMLRKIAGHEYDCCGTLRRCSRCKDSLEVEE